MSQVQNKAASFDAYYFQHGCGIPYERSAHWLNFFGGIAENIVKKIAPQSALDAGCAMGFLVEGLRQRGVDAWGVDVSEYAISHVHPDVKPFCAIGSVTTPFSRKYDLIACIEVLEHLQPHEAEPAIANLCAHTDDILFSSTPADYKEATHFNVQPPEYWAELFARNNFFRDVDFDASFITAWAVRFRRRGEPMACIVRNYERQFAALRKENIDLRDLTREMRERLAAGEEAAQKMTAQVAELERALKSQDQALSEQTSVAQTLTAKLAESDKQIRSLHAELTEQTRANQTLQTNLTAVLNSRSWRIMKVVQRIRILILPPRRAQK